MVALELVEQLEEEIRDHPNRERLADLLYAFRQELREAEAPYSPRGDVLLDGLDRVRRNVEKLEEDMEEFDRQMAEINELNEQTCRRLEMYADRFGEVHEFTEVSVRFGVISVRKLCGSF